MPTLFLQLTVTPRARVPSFTQPPDGTWVAKLKSPPVDGKANAELIVLVAEDFKRSKSAVRIKSGASGRMKLVRINGT